MTPKELVELKLGGTRFSFELQPTVVRFTEDLDADGWLAYFIDLHALANGTWLIRTSSGTGASNIHHPNFEDACDKWADEVRAWSFHPDVIQAMKTLIAEHFKQNIE